MQHVLRAISGPHAGAVYVLGSRTTIGRASDCDIQILHEGVSRHHAKLTLEDDGTVVVADLSSDNGTFVEDERVERHVLAAGEVIRIMRSRFAYEALDTHDAQTSAAFRRKVTSGDSLRQTVHHDKPSTMPRAGVVPRGAVMGERGRPHSRPQAAAPALAGARPGAATTGPAPSIDAPSEALEPAPETVDEAPRVRRPTPPFGSESGTGVRERRSHGSPAVGSGWTRVTRSLEVPGSMRPGSTLCGVPRVEGDASASAVSRSADASSSRERPSKGITAEYGAVGERQPTEHGFAPRPAVAAATAAPPPEAESELDAMKTVPSVRRRPVRRGSATPTEEVPRIRDVVRDGSDDESHKTVPRVTLVPREPGPGPVPSPGGVPEAEADSDADFEADLEAALEADLDAEADLEADPEESRVTSKSLLAVALEPAVEAEPNPGDARPQARSLAYEDTLRFRRPEGLERLVDILEYRELRLRVLQSRAGDARAAERCSALEQALQQRAPADDDMAAMRRYHRFSCSIPAQLTHRPRGTSSTATVEIEDLSAGGARITCGAGSIGAGETVWLTIDLAQADRSRIPYPQAGTVVMKARVVWAQPRSAALGLVFAGAPQYDGAAGG